MIKCDKYKGKIDDCRYEHHDGQSAPCEGGDLLTCPYLDYVREVATNLRSTIRLISDPQNPKKNTDLQRMRLGLAKKELKALEDAFPHL